MRRFAPAIAALAIGLVMSATASLFAFRWEEQGIRAEFAGLAGDRRLLTQSGLHDLEQMAQAICVTLEVSKANISSGQFTALFDALRPQFVGADSVSWVPRVRRSERDAFEHAMADQRSAGYRITEIGSNGAPVTAGDRQEYFPILYIAGPLADRSSLGLDIGSDAMRQGLLERARDDDLLAVSAPIEIASAERSLQIIYLLAPVYEPDRPHDKAEARRQALLGFVQFIVEPGALIQEIHQGVTSPKGLDFYFFQSADGPRAMPFYVRSSFLRDGSAPSLPRASVERGLHATEELTIGDRHWAMDVVPLPEGPLNIDHRLFWVVLIAGFGVTGIAAAYVAAAISHAESLNSLVDELHQRDAILNAVALAASSLASAKPAETAIPKALQITAQALRLDRIVVLEADISSGHGSPLVLRFAWQAPDLPFKIEPAFIADYVTRSGELNDWLSPLAAGEVVDAQLRSSHGAVREFLQRLNARSLLFVPIMLNGKYWGQIGLENCRAERQWGLGEIEALETMAELIGSSIERGRYVQALADADTIIERSPTILFRLRGEPGLPMTYISRNVSRLGYDPSQFIRAPTFHNSLVHPDDQKRVAELQERLLRGEIDSLAAQLRIHAADGTYRWVEARVAATRDADGRLLMAEGILTDITGVKAAAAKIAELARTDALTGLANRTSFLERLELAFATARRGGAQFAVLCLDLDHFKDVNDTLGHPAGDKLLRAIAARVANSLRETDLAARLGGDEFVIMQSDVTEPSAAAALATKIQSDVAAPTVIDGSEVRITTSVGIALYAPELSGPQEILAHADQALYRAKEEGRDRYRYYSDDMNAAVHEQVELAGELRAALGSGELEVFYQPQVAIQSGSIVGLEALLRWHHPRRGLISPAAFLPIAERSGTIVPLGRWVLDQACGQMRMWRDQGLALPVMAINLSAAQLKLGQAYERDVAAAIAKWGLSPADLEFDVSEAVLLDAKHGSPDALDRLRALGVGIAIDDFGSDYTAIGRLRDCHVKHLKIAPQFVQAIARSADADAIVRAIIGLARQLEIEIIAEGVETDLQCAFLLSEARSATAQGFLFREPMPASAAGELLRRGMISRPVAQGASFAAE